MTIVRNVMTDSANRPAPGTVVIRLVGPGLRPITQSEVVTQYGFSTQADGSWSAILEPNSADAPYYIVTEQASREQIVQHLIRVEASNTPVWLGDITVQLPLPFAQAGSIYQGPPGPPGPQGPPGGGGDGSGSLGVVYGTSVDASSLPDGTLVVLLSSDPN